MRTAVRKTEPFNRWANELRERRGTNQAIVLVANKIGRIIWALLAKKMAITVPPPEAGRFEVQAKEAMSRPGGPGA